MIFIAHCLHVQDDPLRELILQKLNALLELNCVFLNILFILFMFVLVTPWLSLIPDCIVYLIAFGFMLALIVC